MKKSGIFAAVATATTLMAGSALASMGNLEKCHVVKDGKGLIKANQSECKSSPSAPCAGQNKAGDPKAWILVPKGECAKINMGDFSGVSPDIKDKIEGAS